MAAVTVLAAPLDRISAQARPYPADMLPVGGTGLCLFAAAFLGVNDAIHMARKDMRVTCVDYDRFRLDKMAPLYPEDWRFVLEDAWIFASRASHFGQQWDVVSIDTFTGDATDRSLESLELWCSLARKAVTATTTRHQGLDVVAPTGWRSSLFPRSNMADWLVLRCD